LSKCISHTRSFSYTIRNSINQAELSWQIVTFLSDFYQKHRLLRVSNFFVVALLKVLSHTNNISLVFKGHGHRVNIEHYISDEISSLVAPVCYDWFVTKLESDNLFETMLVSLALISKFLNSLEASFCRHEFKDRVHD